MARTLDEHPELVRLSSSTALLDRLDYQLLGLGERLCELELKTKRQPYRGWADLRPELAETDHEQVSVRPDQQGAGAGRALLERVRGWAVDSGLSAITLTTFKDVPWNEPLYRHLGFRVLSDDELGPQLRDVRGRETQHGLDPAKRVCMLLELIG